MALSSRLRDRVTIRRLTTTRVPGGGFTETWADLATIWAEVIGVSGRESMIGEAFQGVEFYRITVRYGADVTDADQLVFSAKTLNIRSVSPPDNMREALLILADTGSVQGGS